jgi:RimJ/RimL family protein N-acetyltransferase
MQANTISQYPAIETNRLELVCCDLTILETLLKGDDAIAKHLKVNIPAKWTEFGEPVFRYTYDKVRDNRDNAKWWCYLPVLKETRMLLGTCGYKGAPVSGMVEIGYEISESYRGQGLATEVAGALILEAFNNAAVEYVQAHTLAEENASCAVLRKCGMTKMEEIIDPADGPIWRWESRKPQAN